MKISPEQATAPLFDVVQFAGRGTILVLKDLDGTLHQGDRIHVGDRTTQVIGIEMIRNADAQRKPKDSLGLIGRDQETEAYRAWIEHPVTFRAKD